MLDEVKPIRLLNLEAVNNKEVLDILSEYFIDGALDDDGDVVLDRPSRIYLTVSADFGVLRFFSFVWLKDGFDIEVLSKKLDSFNKGSTTVKYVVMSNAAMVEYGIPLFGHIDHKHLIKFVQHFEEEVASLRISISEHVKG